MPRRATSGIPGLIKTHVRGCSKPKRLEKCGCAWRGYHKGEEVPLHVWCGYAIDPHDKAAADLVFTRMKKAIGDGTFDKAGERKTSTGGTSLSDFIAEWWNTEVVDDADKGTYKLNVSGLEAECEVLKASALGDRSLQDLSNDTDGIQQWLTTTRKQRRWSGKTFNEYRRLLLFFFKRAMVRKKIKFNPIDAIKREKGVDSQREELRHFRMTRDGIQQALLDACDQLNRTQQSPNTNGKLTQEKADAIRAAVEGGRRQKDLATKYGVSAAVVSDIVRGNIWNQERRATTTKGNEMRRRVRGAFDMGPRQEELTHFQIKHVRWSEFRIHPEGHKTYKLVLPAHLTKGGKTTGRDEVFYATDKDHCAMLEERRKQFMNTTLRHDAYIYGTDAGHRVADFKKSWRALFEAAGLQHGVDFGRTVGVVWHTIRHEHASRAVETAPDLYVAQDLTRHRDIKTMKRYVHTRENAAWEAAMGGRKLR